MKIYLIIIPCIPGDGLAIKYTPFDVILYDVPALQVFIAVDNKVYPSTDGI